MATLVYARKSTGVTGELRRPFADAFLALKRAIDDEMLRRRNEAILQSLDDRLRREAGIKIPREEMTEPDANREALTATRLLFSWTRFAK